VQRINLTTALGTSTGQHPVRAGRALASACTRATWTASPQAMHRLRDAGNTLVVVEHDPAVMLAADRVIDMGPGPGSSSAGFDGVRRHAAMRLREAPRP
jgi:excinuclease ABC subunit A